MSDLNRGGGAMTEDFDALNEDERLVCILDRCYSDASYGSGEILTFDDDRYGNILVNYNDGNGVVSVPMFLFVQQMVKDEDLRQQYYAMSNKYRDTH